jgi:hypothetical protein
MVMDNPTKRKASIAYSLLRAVKTEGKICKGEPRGP